MYQAVTNSLQLQKISWKLKDVSSVLYLYGKLQDIHKDPFDRLLIAQAIENDLTIVTTDSKIPQYNVKTIW